MRGATAVATTALALSLGLGLLGGDCAVAAAECRYELLEVSTADEVGEELASARRRFGCEYSGVECTFQAASGGRRWVEGSCTLLKDAADGADGAQCRPDRLQRELEKDLAKDMAKAQRKFGCDFVNSVACASTTGAGGVVECQVITANRGGDAAPPPRPKTPPPPGAGSDCDVDILTSSIEHEITSKIAKAQARFECPAVAAVACDVAPTHKWVDCQLQVEEAAATGLSTRCNMDYLTQSVSKEVGEELADAERKYGCPVPARSSCAPVSSGSARFACTLEYPSDGGAAEEDAPKETPVPPGRRNWKFRHTRTGAHGNL